jgi:non-heme chloroperoxidase
MPLGESSTMNAIEVAQNNFKFPRGTFVTSDGVQLSYIRQGSGRPIVLIHGWSQCAEEFKHQIGPLSTRYDVIAVDQRSHGESQKVSYGLRISRLSKDLYELLNELKLNNVALLGHSMGSSVIWCYIDLFGPERLSRIILVDQPPFVTSDPHWTKQELENSGAVSTAQQVSDFGAALRSKEAEQLTRQVIDSMVTKHAMSEIREWIAQCNLKNAPRLGCDSGVQSLAYRLARFDPAYQPSHPYHRRSSKRDAVEIARMDSSSNQRLTVRSIRRVRRRPALYVH